MPSAAVNGWNRVQRRLVIAIISTTTTTILFRQLGGPDSVMESSCSLIPELNLNKQLLVAVVRRCVRFVPEDKNIFFYVNTKMNTEPSA